MCTHSHPHTLINCTCVYACVHISALFVCVCVHGIVFFVYTYLYLYTRTHEFTYTHMFIGISHLQMNQEVCVPVEKMYVHVKLVLLAHTV